MLWINTVDNITPDTAIKYGEEPVAISMDYYANIGMNKYWNFVRQMGYPIVAEGLENL